MKFDRVKIKSSKDAGLPEDPRVVKGETVDAPQVGRYEFADIKAPKANVLGKGSLGGLGTSVKDRRFNLNPLLRDSLSLDAELERTIEERVNARLKEALEASREEGHKKGFEAGMAEGKEQAYQEFKKEGAIRVDALDKLVQKMESHLGELFRTNEKFFLEALHKAFRKVALRELAGDKEYLGRLTRELTEKMGAKDGIRFTFNPKDAESIESVREGLIAHLGALKNLQFETSPEVGSGGCLLETEWNVIDASLETQLNGIWEALLGAEAQLKAAGA